ncbi:polysaccharide deacetylase family protein [Devosia sp. A369]
MGAHGLMLHHFSGGCHPLGQGAISADQFADMLEFIGVERFLSPQLWVEKAKAGRLEPHDRCITFDDALLCQYEIAKPVLENYGLTAFWFVYSSVFIGNIERLELYRYFRTTRYSSISDFYDAFFECLLLSEFSADYLQGRSAFDPDSYLMEFSFYTQQDKLFRYTRDKILGAKRYNQVMDSLIEADQDFSKQEATRNLWMTDEHLRALSAREHLIGLHSFSHPTQMAALRRDEQLAEYRLNSEHLANVLGVPAITMSHPCGSYDADTLAILAELGVQIGFRANLAPSGGSLYELPRDDHTHIAMQMGLR